MILPGYTPPWPHWRSPDGACLLIQADCLDVLPELPEGSVDCVVTDPPYGIPVGAAFVRRNTMEVEDGSGGHNEGQSWEWLDDPGWLVPGGNVAVFHRRGDSLPPHIPEWHRFYLVKQAPPPTPRPVFVSAVEECSGGRKPGPHRWFGGGYTPNYWAGMTPNRLDASHGHPVEKPVEAMEVLVRSLAGPGEVVCDPFMGSGTTGVAAIQTGRQFIGVEIEPRYYEIAVGRVKAAYTAVPPREAAAGQRSLFESMEGHADAAL